jgi:two-component sensor histidine kinase
MTAKKKDEAKQPERTLDPKSIEALQTSNELLSLFMRYSPVYTYIKAVTPTESRILQASDNYQKMLGSSNLDIVGKTLEDLFPAGLAAKMTADDWAVITNGKMLQTEKDMDDRSYITIKFPFVQGAKNMLAGYMFDITERKQAEKAVEQREQLLKEAQEAAQINDSAKRKQAEEKLQEIEDKLRAGEDKLRQVEERLRENDAKLRAGADKLRQVEEKPREVEEKLREVEDKLREAENKLRAGEEKLQEVEDKLRAGADKLRQVEEKPREVEEKLQENKYKLQKSEDKLREGEDKLQAFEDKLREGKDKLQAFEDKLREEEDKLRENEDKLQASEGKLRKVEEKLQTSEQKLREAEEKLQEKLRTSEQKAREAEEKLQEKLRTSEQKLREAEEKLQEKLRTSEQKLREVEKKLQEKLQVDEATLASLKEKELLLHEIHRHASNDLASIIALMEMQWKTPEKQLGKLLGKTDTTGAALSSMENRVKSVALIHECLYQSQNPAQIDFQDYLTRLVSHLRTSLDTPPDLLSTINAEGIAFKLDTAVPVGMIINELATNTLKYAFPGNKPRSGADPCVLTISLTQNGTDYTLIVDDNGIGLPETSSLAKKSTLGLRLVRMLGVDQLGGKLTLNRTHGTRFILKFNVQQ